MSTVEFEYFLVCVACWLTEFCFPTFPPYAQNGNAYRLHLNCWSLNDSWYREQCFWFYPEHCPSNCFYGILVWLSFHLVYTLVDDLSNSFRDVRFFGNRQLCDGTGETYFSFYFQCFWHVPAAAFLMASIDICLIFPQLTVGQSRVPNCPMKNGNL